ncbi:MAG: D-alanine--D-alanine ligase [Gammaproteobacteria bacterium]|nr:D-alanine--D-alanine ligase [Gammaproteobacteria bacterium]
MTLNIAVIFGGRSVEHEISIISALQCINAIDRDKYEVVPLYISKQGDWYTGKHLLDLSNFRDLDLLLAKSHRVILNQNSGRANFYLEPKSIFTKRSSISIDIAFPVIHGTYGEDGSLQGLLEIMNIPYVGCDVLSSAIAMDKVTTKILLQASGIKVLDYYSFYSEIWIGSRDAVLSDIKTKFTYPLIVKPGNLGSSIGVTAVNDDVALEDAIDLVISLSQRVLIEPHITNLKEINCAVLGDRDFAEVSVCEEPISSEEILTYQDKYSGGGKNKIGVCLGKGASGGMSSAKRKIPAEMSQEMNAKIQGLAKQAFISLNCSGVVRVDFLIDQNTNEIYLCELNTIPGSLAFYLWEPLGKSFTDLTERLIELARKRNREVNNLTVSYPDNILKA